MTRRDDDWSVLLLAGARFGGQPPLGDWQLSRALSRSRPVLYVEPPTFVHDAIRRREWARLVPRVRRVSANMVVLSPIAPVGANRRRGARLGDSVIGAQIARAAAGSIAPPRVLVSFEPRRGPMEQLGRSLFVYWQRDRLSVLPGVSEQEFLRHRHDQLLRTADLVTGVAPALVEDARAAGATAEEIANGVDYDHFAAVIAPRVVGDPGRPKIGFIGGVSWRVDLELLAAVADARPDWDLVLVGERTRDVPDRPNVHALGARPYADLPAWVRGFDVGIVPYRRDEFNLASHPLKVYEYLAAGVPVVSTALPALEGLGDAVRLAVGATEFEAAVEQALKDPPSPSACREMARRNTWDARAGRLTALVEATIRANAHSGGDPGLTEMAP